MESIISRIRQDISHLTEQEKQRQQQTEALSVQESIRSLQQSQSLQNVAVERLTEEGLQSEPQVDYACSQAYRAMIQQQQQAKYRRTRDLSAFEEVDRPSQSQLPAREELPTKPDEGEWSWSKLNKDQKIVALIRYGKRLAAEQSLDEAGQQQLVRLLISGINQKRLTRREDVVLDAETGEVTEVPKLSKEAAPDGQSRYVILEQPLLKVKKTKDQLVKKKVPIREDLQEVTPQPPATLVPVPKRKLTLNKKIDGGAVGQPPRAAD